MLIHATTATFTYQQLVLVSTLLAQRHHLPLQRLTVQPLVLKGRTEEVWQIKMKHLTHSVKVGSNVW